MKTVGTIPPDWRWGTAEGSREFDRLTDRILTFRENSNGWSRLKPWRCACASLEKPPKGTPAEADDAQRIIDRWRPISVFCFLLSKFLF